MSKTSLIIAAYSSDFTQYCLLPKHYDLSVCKRPPSLEGAVAKLLAKFITLHYNIRILDESSYIDSNGTAHGNLGTLTGKSYC